MEGKEVDNDVSPPKQAKHDSAFQCEFHYRMSFTCCQLFLLISIENIINSSPTAAFSELKKSEFYKDEVPGPSNAKDSSKFNTLLVSLKQVRR